jgi:hypothetical protein
MSDMKNNKPVTLPFPLQTAASAVRPATPTTLPGTAFRNILVHHYAGINNIYNNHNAQNFLTYATTLNNIKK